MFPPSFQTSERVGTSFEAGSKAPVGCNPSKHKTSSPQISFSSAQRTKSPVGLMSGQGTCQCNHKHRTWKIRQVHSIHVTPCAIPRYTELCQARSILALIPATAVHGIPPHFVKTSETAVTRDLSSNPRMSIAPRMSTRNVSTKISATLTNVAKHLGIDILQSVRSMFHAGDCKELRRPTALHFKLCFT